MTAEPRPEVLPDPRPTRDKDAALVQQMFDRVAPRYDLANAILSFGSDQHWRRVLVRAVDPQPGERVLDVATGTGLVARELQAAGAHPVALDFSWNMLAAGVATEQSAAKRHSSRGGLRVVLQTLLADLHGVLKKPCLAVLLGELDEHPRVWVRSQSFLELFDTAHGTSQGALGAGEVTRLAPGDHWR